MTARCLAQAACVLIAWGGAVIHAGAAEPEVLEIDFSQTNGLIRPLHGINKGPLANGGLLDLTEEHRQLGVPFVRLHDCHWPNPDVADIHAVFPDSSADPAQPGSYEFALTDEYLNAIRATGAQIVYRLGESIEHTKTKRFVHPPKDAEQWARICLGIIRHYNEGWAGGFHHDIRYWEIWNEPENRPAMWTGTDDEFLKLYRTTARKIKERYPHLKVGGPAFGYSGKFTGGTFQPSEFVLKFLGMCRRESVPLDFFSWHCYTDDPNEITQRAVAIRQLLNKEGFTGTESHLNEWNYLPGNSWKPLSRSSAPLARQRFYEQMGGADGAAFIATCLIELQDAPVDMCNLFHGETGGFGLFTENGVPLKTFEAVKAFRGLLKTPRRVLTRGAVPGRLALAAGTNHTEDLATVLVCNWSHSKSEFSVKVTGLSWRRPTIHEIRLLGAAWSLDSARRETNAAGPGMIPLKLPARTMALITLRPVQ